jgi:protein O-GlcNAc transferase
MMVVLLLALLQAATFVEQGNRYFHQGDFDAAIRSYRLAIDAGLGGDADLRYNLASACYQNGLREDAIREFELVLQLTGGRDAKAHYNLGIILDGDGRHDEAIAHYKRTVELTEDTDPQARQHLGVSNFLKKDYPQAIRELEIYVRQVPDDPGGRLNLAIALRYGGQLDRAVEQLNTAIKDSGDGLPDAHYQLARIYTAQKKYNPALRHFEIALARGVNDPKKRAEYEDLKKLIPWL